MVLPRSACCQNVGLAGGSGDVGITFARCRALPLPGDVGYAAIRVGYCARGQFQPDLNGADDGANGTRFICIEHRCGRRADEGLAAAHGRRCR